MASNAPSARITTHVFTFSNSEERIGLRRKALVKDGNWAGLSEICGGH